MSYLTDVANQRPLLRITAQVLLAFCCAAPLVLAFSSFVVRKADESARLPTDPTRMHNREQQTQHTLSFRSSSSALSSFHDRSTAAQGRMLVNNRRSASEQRKAPT